MAKFYGNEELTFETLKAPLKMTRVRGGKVIETVDGGITWKLIEDAPPSQPASTTKLARGNWAGFR